MNIRALTAKLDDLVWEGLDFFVQHPDGTRDVLFTAPDEKTAEKIFDLIDGVAHGTRISGYKRGFKDGGKFILALTVITASVAGTAVLWYLIHKYGKKKEYSE